MFQGIFIFKVSRIENQILEKNWERGKFLMGGTC